MRQPAPNPSEAIEFRCGAAARWVPRTLAGSGVVAVWLVTSRFENAPGLIGSSRFHLVLWLGAALVAIWVLQKGAESRLKIVLTHESLVFSYGAAPSTLPFGEIATLRFEPPFTARRSWIAATAVLDQEGRSWRLPVILEDGDELIAGLLERSVREDLIAWAEALRVESRMGRGKWHVAAAYAVAVATLIAAVGFYVR